MELGREPYQTELNELVEKEIAAVVSKNEERKRKKGKEATNSTRAADSTDLNERLLQVEDFMERWDEKLEVWGTMISKIYEDKFQTAAPRIPSKVVNDGERSQRDQSAVSGGSKESSDDKDSDKSSNEDESVEGEQEQDDISADQSPPVLQCAGEKKKQVNEKGGVEDIERKRDSVRIGKQPEVWNS
jgi:hypothetical protein